MLFHSCVYYTEMKTRAELTSAAAAALYASKEAGRNRVTHVRDLTASVTT